MSVAIELRDVSKSFANQNVLTNISLTIQQGEIVALLGASGGGKSTLLNLISGLLPADNGDIAIQGTPAKHFQHWQRIAYLFQEDRLLPWRTVGQNVHFGLENSALAKRERRQRVDDALALVGLSDFVRHWPHQLSGGMRSRVALARSLVVQPQILLMDEPFSRLDPQTRSAMHDELLRIQQLTGMTVLLVTHDVEEAVVLADRVVVLKPHPGRIHRQTALNLPRPRIATAPEVNEQIRLLRLEV
ncbi:ABC transporter ATP-binding protein [Affinibrenneria salicis]|uniref:ABC transporter ATP-binding protein n=1 Tax=Affinibrenneria salicis TaxID=2590031 RepID=A0A5J5G7H6_9GAMM|nr:ABC transporter ATP-binding protein [Affinibrenneria salicis]KAA9002719.1 ABC transporter ATP-binding protein [Affinibrenneria salicis]KAA9002994.1 ABC transporter ATP-binding protein [Affinibrenneria salicis]